MAATYTFWSYTWPPQNGSGARKVDKKGDGLRAPVPSTPTGDTESASTLPKYTQFVTGGAGSMAPCSATPDKVSENASTCSEILI